MSANRVKMEQKRKNLIKKYNFKLNRKLKIKDEDINMPRGN